MLIEVICFIGLSIGLAGGQLPNWGYQGSNGPRVWSTIDSPAYQLCSNGTRQSPINICIGGTTFRSGLIFSIMNAGMQLNGTLENLATNVEYAIETPESNRPVFVANYSGVSGYTDGRYILQQFHFHWGSVSGQGSEHLIDSTGTIGEVHFVARNVLYNSSVAANQPNGFLVLGVRLVVCTTSQFNSLFGENNEYLSQVRAYPNKVYNILLNLNGIYNCNGVCTTSRRYYIYQGSFTTPACNEAVTWWVSSDTLCISQTQLDMLRTQNVTSSGPVLTDNFRPDQSINRRVVMTNMASMGTTHVVNSSLLFCLLMMIYFLFAWIQ